MGELTTKGHKGNFRGDGTILYNDCGDDYMTVHLSNSQNFILQSVDLLYVNNTSLNLTLKTHTHTQSQPLFLSTC